MFEAMPRTFGGAAPQNQERLAGKAEPFTTVRRQSRKLETPNSKLGSTAPLLPPFLIAGCRDRQLPGHRHLRRR